MRWCENTGGDNSTQFSVPPQMVRAAERGATEGAAELLIVWDVHLHRPRGEIGDLGSGAPDEMRQTLLTIT
jgi:hypothetical protein